MHATSLIDVPNPLKTILLLEPTVILIGWATIELSKPIPAVTEGLILLLVVIFNNSLPLEALFNTTSKLR